MKIASSTALLLDLGRRPYREALAVQRSIHEAVAAEHEPATWILVEHDPVITLGRNARAESLLFSREALAERGVDVVDVERGGDVTYHGPGQIVLYPIMKLERFREIVPLVSAIEEVVIATLEVFGIGAEATREHRGVYAGRNAICAIGLAVRKMTTMHGLALNVSTSLDYDRLITPCGTPQFGITSMSKELDRPVTTAEVKGPLLAAFADRFGLHFEPASARGVA